MERLLGKINHFQFTVEEKMFAVFGNELIHSVLSTFWLSYYFEWFSRLSIENYLTVVQNSCGAQLTVNHKSPAFLGELVDVSVEITAFERGFIESKIIAKVDDRIIAEGSTTQFVSTKEFFQTHFNPTKFV